MEGLLKDAWRQCNKDDIDPSVRAMSFGKLRVRSTLLLLQKQKHGRDDELESFEQVMQMFANDLIWKKKQLQLPVVAFR